MPLKFPRPPRPPRPAGLSPELQRRWKELLDHHDSLNERDLFSLLGVGEDARADEVESAFALQIKRWHPAQLPEELAVLKPYAIRIVARLNDARESLSNRARRRAHLGGNDRTPKRAPKPGEPPIGAASEERFSEANRLRAQAKALARQRRFDQAVATIERARALDDRNAASAALHAWLLYLRDGQPANASDAVHQLLDQALKRDDRCERAHLYRAVVLKRAGETEQAVRHFQRVVELNPGNLDAARELRLHAARDETKAGR